jgi:two-component system alkaline phosphatase synthesis response regulator PhoP
LSGKEAVVIIEDDKLAVEPQSYHSYRLSAVGFSLYFLTNSKSRLIGTPPDIILPQSFGILKIMKITKPRILAVDDEQAVLDLLVYNLNKAHYEVLTATNGRQALEIARQAEPDLILLDLMLPEIDGLDVCRELRHTSKVPIIMITARGEEVDRVVGLELGADDYICKPFSMRELMARIKAVLRRTAPDENGSQVILTGRGDLRLDVERREVTVGSIALDLTRLEFDLLHALLLNAGRVLTRERLLEQVWGYDFAGDVRAVDSAIKRLRLSLRSADPAADGIEAVRGLGYKFRA